MKKLLSWLKGFWLQWPFFVCTLTLYILFKAIVDNFFPTIIIDSITFCAGALAGSIGSDIIYHRKIKRIIGIAEELGKRFIKEG